MVNTRALPAALFSSFIVVLSIALLGSDWYVDNVVADATSPLDATLKRIPAAFAWSFDSSGAGKAELVGSLAGVILAVVGTFLAVLVVARRASGAAMFIGTWGGVVLAAAFASVVRMMISYGDVVDTVPNARPFGRFWYAVLAGPNSAVVLWGISMGLVVAVATVATAGAGLGDPLVQEPEPELPDPDAEWYRQSARSGTTQRLPLTISAAEPTEPAQVVAVVAPADPTVPTTATPTTAGPGTNAGPGAAPEPDSDDDLWSRFRGG